MEPRIITVVVTGGNQKYEVNTGAETLGELRADLRELGADVDGKVFYEGLTKTELMEDSAILPRDVPFRGQVTNNLAFLVTNPQKKIASGVDRKYILEQIKGNNLQEECKRKFGKNYTNCKTEDLVLLLDQVQQAKAPSVPEPENEPETEIVVPEPEIPNNNTAGSLIHAFEVLVETLAKRGCLSSGDKQMIVSILEGRNIEVPEESPYTDNELKNLFGSRM